MLEYFVNKLLDYGFEESDFFNKKINKTKRVLKFLEIIVDKYRNNKESRYNTWKNTINDLESFLDNEIHIIIASNYISLLKNKAIDNVGSELLGNYYEPKSDDEYFNALEYGLKTSIIGSTSDCFSKIDIIVSGINDYEYSKKEDTDYNIIREINKVSKESNIESLSIFRIINDKELYNGLKKQFEKSCDQDSLLSTKKETREDYEIIIMLDKYFTNINNIVISGGSNTLEEELLLRTEKINKEIIPFLKEVINNYKKKVLRIPEHFSKFNENIAPENIKKKLFKKEDYSLFK